MASSFQRREERVHGHRRCVARNRYVVFPFPADHRPQDGADEALRAVRARGGARGLDHLDARARPSDRKRRAQPLKELERFRAKACPALDAQCVPLRVKKMRQIRFESLNPQACARWMRRERSSDRTASAAVSFSSRTATCLWYGVLATGSQLPESVSALTRGPLFSRSPSLAG